MSGVAGLVVRRLLHAAVLLWLVSTLVFALLHLSPVPVEQVIGGPGADPSTLERIRANLGLDRPVPVQYAGFLHDLAVGDLGVSYISGVPVTELIAARLPTTLLLMAGAMVLAVAGGVALGALSAVRARRPADRAATVLVLVGLSAPPFVAALVLLHLFAGGQGLFEAGPPLQEHFWRRMTLPWIAMALLLVASYARLTRGSLLEVLGQDYIRTARAKGLPERRVVGGHGLRAALAPVLTQSGIDAGVLVGSTIVTEQVFGLQGVGQLVHRSITLGDAPVVIGVTLLVTLFVVVAGLVVDVGYSVLDPRVRTVRA